MIFTKWGPTNAQVYIKSGLGLQNASNVKRPFIISLQNFWLIPLHSYEKLNDVK